MKQLCVTRFRVVKFCQLHRMACVTVKQDKKCKDYCGNCKQFAEVLERKFT